MQGMAWQGKWNPEKNPTKNRDATKTKQSQSKYKEPTFI